MTTTKCVICETDLKPHQIARGTRTCCPSCAMKLRYRNPEERIKTGKRSSESWHNEESRQKRRQSLINLWSDASYKEQRSEAIRAGRNRPEVIQKQSESLRAYKLSDEGRQKNSQRMRDIWADKDRSKNLREAIAKNNANIEVRLKQYATQKKNKKFGKSRAEDYSYEHLCSIYSENDIERQYASNEYPYKADFYIKSLKLYIECNYGWTHGTKSCHEPFDSSNEQHLEALSTLLNKSKQSDYYKNAIYQWTELDVRKRQCALDNKLNWIAFYSEQDFYNYFEKKEDTNGNN